jgi:transposase InsO family protein
LKVSPEIVHADNGNAMRGMTLAAFLDMLCISRSYSRPRCSNDNAFIESWHKILKYSVGYPKYFKDINHARTWYADFINWYNNSHLHSGLNYVTPIQCRTGIATHIYERHNQTILSAYTNNPLRWRQRKIRRYEYHQVETYYRPLLSKNAA